MALTRDQVVETAIGLLDAHGLDALTLRRLAAELGVSAPTLYWHVRDKRELLDLMAEAMTRAHRATLPPLPQGMSWDERIAEGARRQYQALLHYRDGARVVAGNRPTESSLPQIEGYLKIWVEAGFPPDEALATVLSLGDFITGAALEHQAEAARKREQNDERRQKIWDGMADYPTLRAASLGLRARQHRLRSFEHGLMLFLDGIRVRRQQLLAQERKAALAARRDGTAEKPVATRRRSAARPQ